MMKQFNLYLIRNLVNGKMYVGQTVNSIAQRWSQHLSAARRGVNYPLSNAIRKYGVENFTIDPLVLFDRKVADEKSLNDGEIQMIRLLRIKGELYNLTDGGSGFSGLGGCNNFKGAKYHDYLVAY